MSEILKRHNITITAVDGANYRWLDGGEQYLGLGEQLAFLKLKGEIEEKDEDESMPWTQRIMDYHHFAFKKNIVAVELYWAHKAEIWKVDIIIQGCSEDWPMHFASKEEAMVVQERILKWLIS